MSSLAAIGIFLVKRFGAEVSLGLRLDLLTLFERG